MKYDKVYKSIVVTLLIIPNIFVVVLGIESFPYTCAPMFGHYIDNNTPLYLFKFEGVTKNKTVDLIDYLGKPEDFFMRHFFSKVYGSTDAISPFSNKLSESEAAFQQRMNTFFEHYSNTLKNKYNLTFDQINISVVKVNQEREPQEQPKRIGYYNTLEKKYISIFKTSLNVTKL